MLSIACDSCGGIGPKNRDILKTSGETVGKYLARTVLLELLCAGTKPVSLSCGLSVELEPDGRAILTGIKRTLREVGLEVPLVWSSEKNFPVETTGVGLTGLGHASQDSLRIGVSKVDDLVVLLGQPSVGANVFEAERSHLIPSLREVVRILKSNLVHEVLPVGSTGVLYETRVLAADSRLKFRPLIGQAQFSISAGPSTSLLLALRRDRFEDLERLQRHVRVIGILKK